MERKENYQLLKKKLQSELLEALETGGEWSDEEIMGQIDELIVSASRNVYLSGYKKLMMKQELFNSVRRLDLLQELVDDKDITEIMVNGAGDIFYEKYGHGTDAGNAAQQDLGDRGGYRDAYGGYAHQNATKKTGR